MDEGLDDNDVGAVKGRGKVKEVEILQFEEEEEESKPIEFEPKYVDVYKRMNIWEAAYRLNFFMSIYFFYN